MGITQAPESLPHEMNSELLNSYSSQKKSAQKELESEKSFWRRQEWLTERGQLELEGKCIYFMNNK